MKYFYSASTWEKFRPYYNKLNLGNPGFDSKNYSDRKDFIERHGGSYRVVHFDFKELHNICKNPSKLDLLTEFAKVVGACFEEHKYLLEGNYLPDRDKQEIEFLLNMSKSISKENTG